MDGKLRFAAHARMWHIPYVHNPECTQKILRSRLGNQGIRATEVAGLMVEENCSSSKSKGMNTGYTCDPHGQKLEDKGS